MKAKLIPGGMESFNYHLLPGKSLTAQRLGETVDALPMMSPRTLIVVNDYDLFKAPEAERTAMTKILSDLPEYCCLVFVYDTRALQSDARMRKLAGAIREKGRRWSNLPASSRETWSTGSAAGSGLWGMRSTRRTPSTSSSSAET